MTQRRGFRWSVLLLFVFAVLVAAYFLLFTRRSPETYQIYYVGKTNPAGIEFWRTAQAGMEAAARERHVELTCLAPEDESQTAENLAIFEQTVARKPDAILFSASLYREMSEPVAEAVRGGQKVVMLDSGVRAVEGAEPVSQIRTDNTDAGRKIATLMKEDVTRDKRVLIISHSVGTDSADERRRGVLDVLMRAGFQGIRTLDAEGRAASIRDRLYPLLRTQQIDVLVALNEYTTEATARTLQEAGLASKIPLYGIDCSRNLIPFLEDGTLAATVVQRPFNMGYLAIDAAVDAIEGRAVPKEIWVGTQCIRKEDIYLPENQKLLFPFQDEGVRSSTP